jgi:nucleotide-binding universal stress UspA family protein
MHPVNSTYDVRRILCAVDHSEPSLRAADFAMNLAGKCKAELLLLSVVCLPDTTEEAHDSPHFHSTPKVSANMGSSASIAAKRSISGNSRVSGMLGIRS